MRIGYACLTLGVSGGDYKSCIMKNATEERLLAVIRHNLDVLEKAIAYNIENHIQLFRISSDIIPFGSSPVNQLDWDKLFAKKLLGIGQKAVANGMRLSMHPGQYTVINSPRPEVVSRAVADLVYHCRFLDALGLDATHKIVLHIGGVYGDKIAAAGRFLHAYYTLPDAVKSRLVIENDDKCYHIQDVLEISAKGKIPVIFDNLHHEINPYGEKSLQYWIQKAGATWQEKDGRQKVHYSQQAENKSPGSHSATVAIAPFMAFYGEIKNKDCIDIMLEVKDKNISAMKCIHCTSEKTAMKDLEKEWGRYKYTVLEKDPEIYRAIRNLLKDKTQCPAVPFYSLIESALLLETKTGNAVNAAQHVWGYFKKCADEKERKAFERHMAGYERGGKSLPPIKKQLHRLAEKYQVAYLLDSYYFVLS